MSPCKSLTRWNSLLSFCKNFKSAQMRHITRIWIKLSNYIPGITEPYLQKRKAAKLIRAAGWFWSFRIKSWKHFAESSKFPLEKGMLITFTNDKIVTLLQEMLLRKKKKKKGPTKSKRASCTVESAYFCNLEVVGSKHVNNTPKRRQRKRHKPVHNSKGLNKK